ncbi:MAG: hypothetical protein ABI358_06200 [Ginsengibacter sp.]
MNNVIYALLWPVSLVLPNKLLARDQLMNFNLNKKHFAYYFYHADKLV